MELSEIKELINDFEQGSMRELQISDGDFQLVLSKNEALQPVPVATIPSAAPRMTEVNTPADTAEPMATADLITAPLVGSIYLQASTDAAPFVQVGDHVQVGQTVAVIEAMKMMTDIPSPVAGTISEILVANEDIVDFDKPVFKVIRD
ncbi:acetyl-CoA carboxylase, biotin carboxyl carrier protein [Periweissella cryptocerci]|uniref:Biotin carboxyl carrier protein of acetyl-CoA carboxylase n=1 Tax=Periweissella cryptocerci TaxID=2506420 RepID=A0A4P6YRA0_9LACO|nr:biotin/lipoyl-containing protein [Periweissella cryptocerci]QBO35158.1 acetyl-CoA carboxylase, biotin carboxyl carrier protein [Periweissella cryptocerci]